MPVFINWYHDSNHIYNTIAKGSVQSTYSHGTELRSKAVMERDYVYRKLLWHWIDYWWSHAPFFFVNEFIFLFLHPIRRQEAKTASLVVKRKNDTVFNANGLAKLNTSSSAPALACSSSTRVLILIAHPDTAMSAQAGVGLSKILVLVGAGGRLHLSYASCRRSRLFTLSPLVSTLIWLSVPQVTPARSCSRTANCPTFWASFMYYSKFHLESLGYWL